MRGKVQLLLSLLVVACLACNAEVRLGSEGGQKEEKAAAEEDAGKEAADEAPKSAAPAPGKPSALAGKIVPANVDWFGAVNLQALKGTVIERQFKPWLRYLDTLPEYQGAVVESGAGDLLDHAVVFGGTFAMPGPTGFDAFIAVFGLKDEARLAARVGGLLEQGHPREIAGWRTGHKEGVAAYVGAPEMLDDVAAVADGKGKSVLTDESWDDLQRHVNTGAPAWVLSRIPEFANNELQFLHREIPGLQFFPGVIEVLGATHAGFSVDVGDRLEIRVVLKLKSPEDALVVVEQASLAAEAALWEPTLVFETFDFSAQGPLVTFAAATSRKAWRVAVFWASIAVQVAAYEEMRRW